MINPSDLPTDEAERDPDWLTTPEAAKALSLTINTLLGDSDVHAVVLRKSAGHASARAVGWLWFRKDIDRLVSLRDHYGLRTRTAAKAMRKNPNPSQMPEFDRGNRR